MCIDSSTSVLVHRLGVSGGVFRKILGLCGKKRNTIFHTLIPNFLAMLLSDHFLFPQVFCFRLLFWVPRTQKCFRHFSNTQKKSPILFAPKGKNGIIDVRDLAQAVLLVVQSDTSEEYIVTEKTYSFLEVLKIILRVQNIQKPVFSLPHFLGEIIVPTFRTFESCGLSLRSENVFFGFCPRDPNGQKIREKLGFLPKIPLEKTLEDYRDNLTKTFS
jgi:nucleoside-diphosphate-sugar epimerase